MSRLIVGPFNRVEGDLEVRLEIEDARVARAEVNSTLYRGFERILHGKEPAEALVYAPRICGICSVSQSVAAALALADAQGIEPPPNGRRAINILHAVENIADHLSHFYLFFMPDFARPVYREAPWAEDARARFQALKGMAAGDMLPARAELMHVMGILAGKWPHTLSIQPGGSTRAVAGHEIARLRGIIQGFRRFAERFLFGDRLENVLAIESLAALEEWEGKGAPMGSDFRHFLAIARAEQLWDLGRATDRFASFGAYAGEGGGHLFRPGMRDETGSQALLPELIREDVSHARYRPSPLPSDPFSGETEPDADAPDAYSWCKAPRLGGQVVEVGAIARQYVAQVPLIEDLVTRRGGNVHARVVARVREIAALVLAIETWLSELEPGEPFWLPGAMPDEAVGIGLCEAARGSLGHWLVIERGRIANYQIIAPTTWNFSPRDAEGQPGALELALEGAPVRAGESEPVA
ncbi:MAG: nickel-dependent hydrogenase large subunit, partial [Neomegalonema sp.]|nr:nickel-dependent hydrogenase large subunit [Neomegalonema sp.]